MLPIGGAACCEVAEHRTGPQVCLISKVECWGSKMPGHPISPTLIALPEILNICEMGDDSQKASSLVTIKTT